MVTPTVTIADFTTEDFKEGSGIFDVMMRSVKEHVTNEYRMDRIKGTEYSTVYLGGLQAVMTNALQFVMSKDKLTAELALLEVQKQIAEAELELAKVGKIKIEKETEQIEAATCKLKAEFDLIMEQVPKVTAEKALLDQKQTTERAQTQQVATDNSVVGRQMALYKAQADGFKRDAEQKAAKIMVDSWNVRRSTNEEEIASGAVHNGSPGNRLSDANIGDVIKVLKQGINASAD